MRELITDFQGIDQPLDLGLVMMVTQQDIDGVPPMYDEHDIDHDESGKSPALRKYLCDR